MKEIIERKHIHFVPILFMVISALLIAYSSNSYNFRKVVIQPSTEWDCKTAIFSSPFHNALYASIGLLTPYAVDHARTLYSTSNFNLLTTDHLPNILLMIILALMQSFNIYFVSASNESFHIWNYYTGTYIELVVLYNMIMVLQLKFAEKTWDLMVVLLLSSILTSSALLVKLCAAFSDNYFEWKSSWFILFGLSMICNLYIAGNWLDQYWVAQKTGQQTQPALLALLQIMALVGFVTTFMVLDMSIPSGDNIFEISTEYIVGVQVLILSVYFAVQEIVNHGNKNMYKLSEQQLETKRAFVRYVSHEIRTPLSSTLIGLELLEKDVKLFHSHQILDKHMYDPKIHSTDTARTTGIKSNPTISTSSSSKSKKRKGTVSEESLLDLIHDTSQSCNIAIEILNDLLLYEKIDGGLLALDSHEVLLWPFVLDVLKLFDVQAKAKEVEVVTECNIHSDIYTSIDTYKMSQVIRNLVSNALKFSTSGSKIYVLAEIGDSSFRSNFFDRQNNKIQKNSLVTFMESKLGRKPSSDSLSKDEIESSKHFSASSVVNYSKATVFGPDMDMVRISVVDFGAGLSKENQKRLFKEIVQFDAAKLQEGKGSGIGLWVSNRIMKLHGGNIGVESAGEGCGSTFFIDIPITRTRPHQSNRSFPSARVPVPEKLGDISSRNVPTNVPDNEVNVTELIDSNGNLPTNRIAKGNKLDSSTAGFQDLSVEPSGRTVESAVPTPPTQINIAAENSNNKALSAEEYSPKTKLLIVDDSAMNRKLMRRALADLFDGCDEAINGADAVEKAEKALLEIPNELGYHVVITDYSMPIMGGQEAIQRLRKLGYKGKIIGLTGNTETGLLEDFQRAGADMVLIKPFQTEDLRKILQGWLAEMEYWNSV